MRLIDADAFFEDFPEVRDYEWVSQEYEVDAVPVVRCGDCKHREGRECNLLPLGGPRCGVADDWFCADGERRADDETD